METFDKLFAAAPDVPILIFGRNGNEALAKQAVGRGAQDYLLQDHLDSYSLPRALRNAIERKAVEDALYVEKERALVTLNSIGDAVLSTDISGNITYLNLVAETMTGWRREEAIGKLLAEVFRIVDGGTRKPAKDPMEMAMEQNRTVGLTVNDFGTGYSSLSYLRRFPIDVLKIDQSFVQQMTSDLDDSSIVSAIISMGKSLKHVVVAEGIETLGQKAYLQTQQCQEGQGYLFSRPVAAAQFAELLQMGITDGVVH
jgi:hypothetical protein